MQDGPPTSSRHRTTPGEADATGTFDPGEIEDDVVEAERLPLPTQLPAAESATMGRNSSSVRRLPGRLLAVGVAVLVSVGIGAVAARDADDGSASESAAVVLADQGRAARAQMVAAANRGDFDRAIALSRGAEAEGYRTAAATVLVRRADKAASRGDLRLARARLRAAQRRYGTAPGAGAVQRRVGAIERARRRRAERQRADARKDAASAATPAVVAAPAASAPQVQSEPRQSAVPQRKGTGGGATAKRRDGDEQGVDPGLIPASGE